jgi:hypothetical protein
VAKTLKEQEKRKKAHHENPSFSGGFSWYYRKADAAHIAAPDCILPGFHKVG